MEQLRDWLAANHYRGIYLLDVGEDGSYFAHHLDQDDPLHELAAAALTTGRAELRQAEETRADDQAIGTAASTSR